MSWFGDLRRDAVDRERERYGMEAINSSLEAANASLTCQRDQAQDNAARLRNMMVRDFQPIYRWIISDPRRLPASVCDAIEELHRELALETELNNDG